MRLTLGILQMEQQLQFQQALEPIPFQVVSDTHTGRTTQRLNLSAKYTNLLSKNRREEVERETIQKFESIKPEVLSLCIYAKRSLF